MPSAMPEIRKILYATDLSENALYAFGCAVQIARKFAAKITVIHVSERVSGALGDWVKEQTEEEEIAHSVETIRDRLGQFCAVMDEDITCLDVVSNVLLRIGEPADEILRAAREESSDIIVLGTHSKGFLNNAVLGSVSRKVLYRSLRPVFLVPLPDDKGAGKGRDRRTL